MLTIGLMLKAYDQMSGVVASAAARSTQAFSKLQAKIGEVSAQLEHLGRQSVADGLMIGGVMEKPLKAFADLDEASTNLRVAMMDNLGRVPSQLAEINRQAIELGNVLPGTTADFVNAATALIENGTGLDQLVGGGLKAASYLSVILKMVPRDAAEMTAKFREAFGLTEHELVKMADLTQRAKFAFGLNPEEIKYAAQYSGATLNALRLTGAENAKKMLAFQGFARQRGMEGSVFGTNFAQMLNQIGQLSDKLGRASRPMREVNKELAQYGIELQFFDKQGKFLGLENLFAQMTKLRSLTEQQRLFATNKLFGMEGGRVAAMAIDMGPEGLQKNLALMDRQADLMQRIDAITKSAKNTWEAFTGTITNVLAAIGKPLVETLQPLIVKLNELTGGPLMEWVERHAALVRVIGLSVMAVGLLLGALGTLALVVGTTGRVIASGMTALSSFGGLLLKTRLHTLALTAAQRAQAAVQALTNTIAYRGGVWQALQFALLTTRYRVLEATGAMRAWVAAHALAARTHLLSLTGLRSLGAVFAERLVSGLRSATVAVRTFSVALLTNPITWIVVAIAAAAFLIWKFWKPIAGFFSGLWAGIKAGLTPLMPLFNRFAQAFAPALGPLKTLWGWFARLFSQVEDTGGAAHSLGVQVGKAIGNAIVWVVKLGSAVFSLPGRFFDAGVAIIQGLWRGITSMASRPVEAIRNIGAATATAFKSLLGIHSPSRVFMVFGDNIAQGAALGINRSSAQASRAAHDMATRTARAAIAPSIRVPLRLHAAVGVSQGATVAAKRQGVAAMRVPLAAAMPSVRLPQRLRPVVGASQGATLAASHRRVAAMQTPQGAAGRATSAKTAPPRAPLRRDGGDMTIHYSPVIHVPAGSPAEVKDAAGQALKLSQAEFEQMLRRSRADQERRRF
jgi:TP901 family phage tail tape measure protein